MAGSFFSSSVSALNTSVNALFLQGFSEAQNTLPWKELATDLGKSNHATRALDFMGAPPDMQDVTHDTLRVGNVRRYSWTMSHKVYKAALRVSLGDLETDNLGQIPAVVKGAARKAAGHPGRLMFDQLEANPTAYDLTDLFSDTRTWGAGANYDNIVSGTGVTASAITTDLQSVRVAMMQAEDDTGEPMELAPNVIIIPPGLEATFRQVLQPLPIAANNQSVAGAIPPTLGNRWQAGGYTVYTLARLTDTNNWYALHVGEEINPFVFSWVAMPAPMNTPGPNDQSAIENDVLEYVIRGRYNVGVSLPQYFASVTN